MNDNIRNFCIIAHIDHGKSTLADRLIELTKNDNQTVIEQTLDSMDLERERGITIKAKAIRLLYNANNLKSFQLNLIDTPGHVDFSYEVSRSLSACEGALLIVDATQGIQAQTVANVYKAIDQNLTLIPVINKIDLDVARPQEIAKELQATFGFTQDEILMVSAKSGKGIPLLLETIVNKIPPPIADKEKKLRALIFDSKYDPYKGVVAFVRIIDGALTNNSRILMMSNKIESDIIELGILTPGPEKVNVLAAGEVGYIASGLKSINEATVGDTITNAKETAETPLDTYTPLKSMVFAGVYPADGEDYETLKDALDKLRLNDASLNYTPENSLALGSGFRCGFLGLLHMEIIQERLEREYELTIIITAPSVSYKVVTTELETIMIDNPSKLPEQNMVSEILEPWANLTILTPSNFIGQIMDLVTNKRGKLTRMEYIQSDSDDVGTSSQDSSLDSEDMASDRNSNRVILEFDMPMSEMLVQFYDQLKSRTQGYASMDYSVSDYQKGNLVKLDILVNSQKVDALSIITHRDESYSKAKQLVAKLQDSIPRQLFEVPIQAAIGAKIISRTNIKALKKNVLAKCYGGDVTRKRKLLQKQAEGKKRMKKVGRVEIPQEAFLSVLNNDP